MPQKITIDPVTRVEGHGKVTIRLDDAGHVEQARLHIVEFRGFERFVQGRPYWEVPVLVQRLCGICPVSHHLAGAKAVDEIVGVKPSTGTQLTKPAEKLRRLMHYGQMFQSHVLHFFYLCSPDLVFGVDGDIATRNIVGIAQAAPELATKAILMRKFGQEIIKATAGKKIHGISAVPGGIHKNLSIEERDYFLNGKDIPNIDTMIEWSAEAVAFFKDFHAKNQTWSDTFAAHNSAHMGLVSKDGGMDFYHGNLRVVDSTGRVLLDDVDYHHYLDHLGEETKSWSYMKFPFLKLQGSQDGWYRVGPLARVNVCDYIPSKLANEEYEIMRAYTHGKPNNMTMHYHWARLIETLHAAEVMKELLNDPDLQKTNLITKGTKTAEGIGVIEAPRGTLLHHYRVGADDRVTMCNLIVSTTHNNNAMNAAVTQAALDMMEGNTTITEPMMNGIEVAIRAYDPCLSCATHALGQMPLEVTLIDSKDNVLDVRVR
ncbi:MAG: Ni/Fe hydrogenase subunit alpha [Gammaproteobacteria bacterium]|nr:Ni/Fe hydrogenase subunit alpha [Gammaproteobacteria bacterium]